MSYESRDAYIIGPTSAVDTSGRTGVYRYASSTSNVSAVLPSSLATGPVQGPNAIPGKTGPGPFVRIQSVGVLTQVSFTNGAQTLVLNQAAALGTGHASAGWSIPAGSFLDVMVPPNRTHLNFISDDTGGYVEIYCSEGGVL